MNHPEIRRSNSYWSNWRCASDPIVSKHIVSWNDEHHALTSEWTLLSPMLTDRRSLDWSFECCYPAWWLISLWSMVIDRHASSMGHPQLCSAHWNRKKPSRFVFTKESIHRIRTGVVNNSCCFYCCCCRSTNRKASPREIEKLLKIAFQSNLPFLFILRSEKTKLGWPR